MQSLRPIIVPHNRYEHHEHKIQVGKDKNLQSHYVSITPLGSGQEVGRSCIIIKYREKSVMLDCGLHPALRGQDAMPYLDFLDLETVDLLLVTHFHLDHAACLPYFLTKTSFKSRCFMTHPTKSIYKLIVQDFVKVSTLSLDTVLFGEKELMESMDKIETIDYHQDKIVNGIKFRAYHAGHVLGAAMFMIEIANVKILYTGDYSCDDDRHLKGAEIPNEKPDILIIESTFGTQSLRDVRDREREFTGLVHQIIKRGGRCLIPVFALGRAQELLLIMDEYWSNNKSLHHIPIYYASALAKKCLQVYQTYINMMNPRIQQQYKVSNPFEFKHVFNLRSRDQFNDVGPSVVFASPGMLQNGLSRELFELWCTDRRNGLVIPGYAVEGTLAKIVQSEPREVDGMRGNKLPLRMTVHYVMFAAHADHDQTKKFITALKPPNVILVHGERKAMSRVKLSLNRSFGEYIRISDPANCQSVRIEFRKDKICKVMGHLVDEMEHKSQKKIIETPPEEESQGNFDGLLIRKDFNYHIIAPKDLSNFTPLTSTKIEQSIMIPFNQSFTALSLFISRIYDIKYINNKTENQKIIVNILDDYNVSTNKNIIPPPEEQQEEQEEEEEEEEEEDDVDIVLDDNHNRKSIMHKPVMNPMEEEEEETLECKKEREEKELIENDLSITLEKCSKKHIVMKWKSSPISDMIADSIIGLTLTLDVDPSTAIAQQMMQPVNDMNENYNQQNRQSQPTLQSNNISEMLSSKDAFQFILNEHFDAKNVKCIEENINLCDLINKNNENENKQMVLWENRNVLRYKFVVEFEGIMATISFKYNYKRLYDTQKNQKYFWNTKKEKLENNLQKKNNSKIQKKLCQFETMLDMIDENENVYFDQQFVPSFEVECENEKLKQRIESILFCVDNALYPISCNFNCINDFNSNFENNYKEEEVKEEIKEEIKDNNGNDIQMNDTNDIQKDINENGMEIEKDENNMNETNGNKEQNIENENEMDNKNENEMEVERDENNINENNENINENNENINENNENINENNENKNENGNENENENEKDNLNQNKYNDDKELDKDKESDNENEMEVENDEDNIVENNGNKNENKNENENENESEKDNTNENEFNNEKEVDKEQENNNDNDDNDNDNDNDDDMIDID